HLCSTSRACTFVRSSLFMVCRAVTGIYALSLHDALPICDEAAHQVGVGAHVGGGDGDGRVLAARVLAHVQRTDGLHAGDDDQEIDRKSTRLNSSHRTISYAVFCLKKKKVDDLSKGTKLGE